MGSGQAGKVFHLCLVANAAALLVLLRLTSNLGIDFMLFPEPGHTGHSLVETSANIAGQPGYFVCSVNVGTGFCYGADFGGSFLEFRSE